MAGGKIQVVTNELYSLSDSIKSGTNQIKSPHISKDSATTILGNKDAKEAIEKINSIVSNIHETCNDFGNSLRNYADAMKAADTYDA